MEQEFNFQAIVDYVSSNWELGEVHGIEHWKRVERNGLLLAVELGSSERLYKIMDMFIERGILSDWFLYCDTAFRISPPLVISDSEIRECVELIINCLNDL